ncbi:MAG: family 43 glycosylhydrolase [Clostridia bacterium]|nr:family 43 glycosylhydrolase [Clostridia bacterium]
MNKTLKKILSGFISLSMLCTMAAIPASVFAEDTLPEDELLMNITFDEEGTGTGSFAATTGGTVKENGSVSYVDNYDASSKALKISTDAAGNYLELPKGILNGKEAATFSFWIKPGSRWAFMTTPVNGTQTGDYEKYIGMLASPSMLKPERYNNNGKRLSFLEAGGSYTDWIYVTVVFETNALKLYVNGDLISSDSVDVNIKDIFTADASTWIGHGNWGAGEGFSGMMDDFRIYGKALSAEEITALSAKAVEREKQKLLSEKNCLEIDTQFYSNYDVTENGNDVTVSLPSVSEDKFTVIAASYTDGVLSSVDVKKDTDINKDTKSVTFTGLKKNTDDKVKVFVWNSVGGLQPIKDNKVFQIADGQKVTVKTRVTNYTPSESNISFDIIPYDSNGNALTSTASASVSLGIMDSKEFSETIIGDSSAAYYKVNIRSLSDSTVDYDAGYLPVSDVSFPDAAPADSAATTEGAHDPTIFKDPVSHHYFAYSSHNLVFESEDLVNWEKHDYTRTVTVPEKAKTFIANNYSGTTANGTYWAPDILYKEGDEYPYWFYLSTSCGLGGRNSVISLVKAKSPGLWDGETQDCGVVVASKENSNYNTNAIDANIFTDSDGKTYFIWGSFWKGIHMAELNADTGLVKGVDYTSDATILSSCQKFGTRMYSTPAGVAGPEGPYTVYNEDTGYRYMFTSYGWLGTNYNIRIARTDKTFAEVLENSAPHRLLLDQQDRPVGTTYADQVKEGGTLSELWGYKMSGSFQLGDGIEYLGSGHNSVFKDDDGSWYLVQHCRKVADAVAFLQVKKILWTEDGWPVISPLVYAGEKEQAIPEKMLYGTWDLSSVGHTIFAEGVTDVSKSGAYKGSDLPVHSSEIILQADGTLGNDLGTWEYDGNHTVTLNFEADGDEEKYEFYKNGDIMKLFVLTGYDKDKRESAIVMTGTDQNSIASFAKKKSAVAQSTKIINHVDTTPITVTKSVGGNPILKTDDSGNLTYTGDPAAIVVDNKVYLYVGHDTGNASSGYAMPNYLCYSSDDMVNWTYKGIPLSMSDVSWASNKTSAWAGQVIEHNGTYYYYFCTWDKNASGQMSIGVATSTSPTGPFKDSGTALISGAVTTYESNDLTGCAWNDIDPTILIDTDSSNSEHIYLCWGNSKVFMCELNSDMVSVKDINNDGSITFGDNGDIKEMIFTDENISYTFIMKNFGDNKYTEAPYLYKRGDLYYLFFAANYWGDVGEEMAYATAENPWGPWTFQSVIMPQVATSNTNHPAILDFNDKTYFIYHNGSLPGGTASSRSVCVAKMEFNEDGTVKPIAELSTGLNGTASTIKSGDLFVQHTNFTNTLNASNYPVNVGISIGTIPDDSYDAAWEITPGLYEPTNENYVSIQSVNKPGCYIAASGTDVKLQHDNTGSLTKKMTFKTVKGINNTNGTISFESVAKPGYFLTVSNGSLKLSDGVDTNSCSFTIE